MVVDLQGSNPSSIPRVDSNFNTTPARYAIKLDKPRDASASHDLKPLNSQRSKAKNDSTERAVTLKDHIATTEAASAPLKDNQHLKDSINEVLLSE